MRHIAVGVLALAVLVVPTRSTAQNGNSDTPPPIDNTIDAAEEEGEVPARRLVSWNEYDGKQFSIRVGGGYLLDYAAFSQDADSKEQVALRPDEKIRDTRVLFKGRLKFLGENTTYSVGVMYDRAREDWVFRQTGIMFAVPKVPGRFFVGRTKEGFSLNKVMVGYGGWTMERAPISDATLPILADGVKWLGFAPKARLIWNVGFYGDSYSQQQSFSTYDNQISGRLAWLPVLSEETLLHVGISLRHGKPDDGKLNLRARPGAWPAPYFVETGSFDTTSTTMTGVEVYYRPGRYTFGSELFFQNADAPDSGDPFFHGGEVFGTWLITGETRGYNTQGGYFNQISPARPVFSGGPGAWELVGHATWIDLDSGTLSGGKFWRLTPMVNWYVSDHVRLEMAYGYGSLDRFGLTGKTHFFQTRLQLQL